MPRGVEVLIKKAAVDPEFRQWLLAERAAAAGRIGLTLAPAEAAMLCAAPVAQLEGIISRTNVPQEHRRAFLGQAAATMLAALGTVAVSSGCPQGIRPGKNNATKGIRPDLPETKSDVTTSSRTVPMVEPTKGTRPDRPDSPAQGIRPDLPEPRTRPSDDK